MDDYLKGAIEIARAQASVRTMTGEEIIALIQRLAADMRNLAEGEESSAIACVVCADAAKKSIREKSVICLECGKSFKLLTHRHLASHGLDAVCYRNKWGLKKETPLICKDLQRTRRKKIQDMKLWEKQRKVAQ